VKPVPFKRFCKQGHDTSVTGRYPGSCCKVCGRAASSRVTKKLRIGSPEQKAKHTARVMKWQKNNPMKVALSNYRSIAKRHHRAFAIPEVLFYDLISDSCFYCGQKPDPLNGIDRVDNSKGYVEDNVVSCCEWCNRAKLAVSREKFEQHCIAVADMASRFARSS
jgi:hypothetical protein